VRMQAWLDLAAALEGRRVLEKPDDQLAAIGDAGRPAHPPDAVSHRGFGELEVIADAFRRCAAKQQGSDFTLLARVSGWLRGQVADHAGTWISPVVNHIFSL